MPLDHSKATAKVSVTGLALSCYNKATANWEVGLIRSDNHVLRITVGKKDPDGGVSVATFEIDDRHKISITAANAVVPAEPLFTKDPFNRKDPASDPEDLRWIVDFEREFNDNKTIPLKKVPVTEMFVSQPVLYADPDKKKADLKLVDIKANPDNKEGADFGTIAEICSADITCNPGGAVILQVDGPLGFSVNLPHIEGRTHIIRIENECPEVLAKEAKLPSDFSLYFGFMNLPAEPKLDLRRKSDGPQGSDAVCNPGFMSARTSLLPM